jgi:hypothetical protein
MLQESASSHGNPQQRRRDRRVRPGPDQGRAGGDRRRHGVTTAEFGAFFYNLVKTAASRTRSTRSPARRGKRSRSFRRRETPRCSSRPQGHGRRPEDDITKDPRYGHNTPHHGMPKGHLPVRSYLAVPAGSIRRGRRRIVLRPPDRRALHRATRASGLGIASWASVALENARWHEHAGSQPHQG